MNWTKVTLVDGYSFLLPTDKAETLKANIGRASYGFINPVQDAHDMEKKPLKVSIMISSICRFEPFVIEKLITSEVEVVENDSD